MNFHVAYGRIVTGKALSMYLQLIGQGALYSRLALSPMSLLSGLWRHVGHLRV